MRWASLDLAAVAGFASWKKNELQCAGLVYKHTKKRKDPTPWAVEEWFPPEFGEEPRNSLTKFQSERACWEYLMDKFRWKALIVEDTVGGFQGTNIALAEARGYVLASCGLDRKKDVVKLNVNSWRSAIKHMVIKTDKWPAGKWPGKALNKEVAVDVVYRATGLELNHNAADAVCLGLSYLGTSGG